MMFLRDQHVERRDDKKREDRPDRHSADEDQTDRISRGGACPGNKSEREVAGDSRDGRHHYRTQPNPSRLRDRLEFR